MSIKAVKLTGPFGRNMRREQQLRQCAAFYPTQSHFHQSAPGSFGRKRRLSHLNLLLLLGLLGLLSAFFPGARLHAQTGSITGTVVDASADAIPGASIQIADPRDPRQPQFGGKLYF